MEPSKWRVEIREWFLKDRSNGSSPEFVLCGKIFGHPKFRDGSEYFTSKIVGWFTNAGSVITSSGMTYYLGKPDEKWALEHEKTCAMLKAV